MPVFVCFIPRRTWRRLLILPGLVVLALGAGFAVAAVVGLRPSAPATAVSALIAPGSAPVMIDPGHGGIDGGARWQEILEKNIVLDVGLRLREHLHAAGVPTEMTRDADVDLGGPATGGRHRRDLQERLTRTRQCAAKFLVSLHVNASRQTTERGMLLLYPKGSDVSRKLADALTAALAHLHTRREPPIPRSNLYILRNCHVPVVIVEIGFLTNSEDRLLLAEVTYRDQVAKALAGAIAKFYQTGTQ